MYFLRPSSVVLSSLERVKSTGPLRNSHPEKTQPHQHPTEDWTSCFNSKTVGRRPKASPQTSQCVSDSTHSHLQRWNPRKSVPGQRERQASASTFKCGKHLQQAPASTAAHLKHYRLQRHFQNGPRTLLRLSRPERVFIWQETRRIWTAAKVNISQSVPALFNAALFD